jgi:hypothetical protein
MSLNNLLLKYEIQAVSVEYELKISHCRHVVDRQRTSKFS